MVTGVPGNRNDHDGRDDNGGFVPEIRGNCMAEMERPGPAGHFAGVFLPLALGAALTGAGWLAEAIFLTLGSLARGTEVILRLRPPK